MIIDKYNIRDVILDNVEQMGLQNLIEANTDYFKNDEDIYEIENIIIAVFMDIVKYYDFKIHMQ